MLRAGIRSNSTRSGPCLSISIDYFKVLSDLPEYGVVTIKEVNDSSITIETDFDKPLQSILVIAVYDGMILKSVKTETVDISEGLNTLTREIDAKDKTVKVFLWNQNLECFTGGAKS